MYDLRVMGDFSLETFSIDQSIAQTQRADTKRDTKSRHKERS